MMQAIPYFHVDAFAERVFAGNPAAVMLLDEWPRDALLQAIAEENNFAETAFLTPDKSGAADRELRWFTPTMEVRLCGHATLAAGHVLLSQCPGVEAVRFATRKAGLLEVRRLGAGYELGLPAIPVEPAVWPEAVEALGAAPAGLWRSRDGYTVFLFESAAAVRALSPRFAALAALGAETFIATAPGGESDTGDIVSRVFVPGAGVEEDSVTGAAHAVLTPFWAQRLERPRFRAIQASRRGGALDCRLEGDRVWLGGRCVTVVEGRFFL